jgi:hypothetical protein
VLEAVKAIAVRAIWRLLRAEIAEMLRMLKTLDSTAR